MNLELGGWEIMSKIFNKVTAIIISVLILSTTLVGCGNKDATLSSGKGSKKGKVELKMSVTSADGSTWTKGAEKFAELVKEKTDGAVEVKVYPNEQLSGGNQGKGVEMLRNGSIDISFHSNIIYSIMDERFGVISLPWLLPDHETVDAKLNGTGGEVINEILDEIGIVGLGFGENGFRQITNSTRAIRTPEDMEGLKIRIPGIKMYISLYKALGADPIAMNFAEVFTSLQQKAIDGQENPTDIISSSKLYEVQNYLSVWNYSYDAIILGMNKEKFNSFDEEIQQALREAAQEACEYQVQLNRELEEEQLAMFEEKGMEVLRLTPEEIAAFQDKMGPVYEEYESIIGKDLIDAFR